MTNYLAVVILRYSIYPKVDKGLCTISKHYTEYYHNNDTILPHDTSILTTSKLFWIIVAF